MTAAPAAPQLLTLRLEEIVEDACYQPRRDGVDDTHVEDLTETPEQWPPVLVARVTGVLVLVDGFHRVSAARALGMDTIAAQLMEAPADGDLHALAFRANATHGRPLTRLDKRTEAVRLLNAQPQLSDEEIGRRCLLNRAMVWRIRQRLEQRTGDAVAMQQGNPVDAGDSDDEDHPDEPDPLRHVDRLLYWLYQLEASGECRAIRRQSRRNHIESAIELVAARFGLDADRIRGALHTWAPVLAEAAQ